ncbi:hypothetical protein V2W45_1524538 [Cenococcum geophilum]
MPRNAIVFPVTQPHYYYLDFMNSFIGCDNNAATDRFCAILSATLKLTQAEQSRNPSALIFISAFRLLKKEPTVADLCGAAKALISKEKDIKKSGYIRIKLTDNEARMHLEKIKEFAEAIPSSLIVNCVRVSLEAISNTVDFLEKVLIIKQTNITSTNSTADNIKDWAVNQSEAIYLARRIYKEWLQDFRELESYRVDEVVTNSGNGQKPKSETLLNKLRKHSLENRVLVLFLDGVLTNGDPLPIMQQLKKENVIIVIVYLTSDPNAALYTTVNSAAALNKFCSILLAAYFGLAKTLLNILSRVNLNKYINNKVCYAYATAFILHSALLYIVGRTNSYPTIKQIRDRILTEFPEYNWGWNTEVYPPLRFNKAVLRRRFILSTFHLLKPGWDAFDRYFCSTAATRCNVLTRAKIEAHRDLKEDGGHAVALVGCAPNALTVEDASSLKLMYERDDRARARVAACFYDLDRSERVAYKRRCLICRNISPVIKFGGNVLRAIYPAEGCGEGFKP